MLFGMEMRMPPPGDSVNCVAEASPDPMLNAQRAGPEAEKRIEDAVERHVQYERIVLNAILRDIGISAGIFRHARREIR